MAFRAGRMVARKVDTPATVAGCVDDASFADSTGHSHPFLPAGDFNIFSKKTGKSRIVTP